jgi:hypothetical protein
MQNLLDMPSHYKLYTGHDYPPADSSREPVSCVTVAEQLESNEHAKRGTVEQDFVNWRRERDSSLREPKLLHQALQVNIRGGRLPLSADGSQRTFLQVQFHVPYSLC